MAFNKNKTIALAQKYVQKGQFDRAIKEYKKVLEVDKRDIRTALKVGDLYAKKGDNQEAARIYQDVAETYAKDGFFLKAVAVYKNILKLCPDLVEINLKLGDLYHQLSLLGDAMTQYQIVVNYYDRNGMVKESLDTLKKMVELDPENITFKINLAELYHKEGHIQQAMDEFEGIASELKESNNEEELIKVYEKIIHHDPERIDIVKGLARCYINTGQSQKALAKLQISFKNNPKDPETLELLAQVFMQLDQPKKAKSVFKELFQVYQGAGDQDNANRVLGELQRIAPDDAEVQAMAGGEPAEAAPPPPPPPPAEAAPEPPPEAPPVDLPMDDVSEMPEPAQGFDAEVHQLDEEVTEFTMHSAEGSILDPIDPSAPAESDIPEPPPEVAPVPEAPAQDAVIDLTDASVEEEFVDLDEEIGKLMTETEVYIKYGLNDKAKDHLELILKKKPDHQEAKQKYDELFGGGEAPAPAPEPEPPASDDVAQDIPQEIPDVDFAASDDLEPIVADLPEVEPAVEAPDFVAPEALDVSPELDSEEAVDIGIEVEIPDIEVESSEISIAPEIEEAAEAAPEPIITEPVAEEPEIDLAVDAPATEEPIVTEPVAAEPEPEPEPTPEPEVEVQAPVVEESLSVALPEEDESPEGMPLEVREELDEAEFFVQQGLNDEAKGIYADLLERFPDLPELKAEVEEKLKQIGPLAEHEAMSDEDEEEEESLDLSEDEEAVEAGEENADFDLAAELSAEFEALDVQEEQEDEESEQVDFSEVFEEFKQGVAKQIGNEDVDTHFDLGVAYKEMHLLDDAIREFELVIENESKVFEAQTMIGLCYMDKGAFNEAEVSFQNALQGDNLSTSQRVGLLYELGMAQVGAEKAKEALASFQEVHELDSEFRGVKDKIAELEAGSLPDVVISEPQEDGAFDLGASLAEETDVFDDMPTEDQTAKDQSGDGDELTDISAFDTPSEQESKKSAVPMVPKTASKSKSKKTGRKSKSKISYI